MLRRIPTLWLVLFAVLLPVEARAHFLWLVRQAEPAGEKLHLYFSELAEADDPDLLERVKNVEVWQITPDRQQTELQLRRGDESLEASLADASAAAIYLLSHEYGVLEREGQTFLLRYHAATGPALGDKAWATSSFQNSLDLGVVPEQDGDHVRLTVLWKGMPASGVQINVAGPGIDELETTTDEAGQVKFAIGLSGIYSIRARHIEMRSGTLDGKSYDSVRHYSTVALNIDQVPNKPDDSTSQTMSQYPPLPEAVTSFGAAIAGDSLYVYGGHTGEAHSYSHAEQGRTLWRLNLKQPGEWESLGSGPALQGLAMVAHGGKLYRTGGFTAKNEAGEEHDLWSQSGVSCFDPKTGTWSELAPLPEPRSSFDAAVLGDKIYVVGGWQLAGPEDTVWHNSAYVLNLSADEPQWESLPEAPFQRRALTVAAHAGKLFVIGGMQHEGGPTTQVAVFDPQKNEWLEGPSLVGEPMEGFGCSAFATGGKLYVSTIEGNLHQLSDDGSTWEIVKKLDTARFFHRMLPLNERQFLIVGGANMSIGKFEQLEVVELE